MLLFAVVGVVSFNYLIRLEGTLGLMEMADDLSNSILEVRRYEKNFLLYGHAEDFDESLRYIDQARTMLAAMAADVRDDRARRGIAALSAALDAYQSRGLAGSINWAMQGMVDIRLTLIILGGSLLGVQLGAIGTTFVKEHMIKIVMGSIMLIVAVSRGLAMPKYLAKLGLMEVSEAGVALLDKVSFGFMVLSLLVGAVIILGSMIRAKRPAPAVLAQQA